MNSSKEGNQIRKDTPKQSAVQSCILAGRLPSCARIYMSSCKILKFKIGQKKRTCNFGMLVEEKFPTWSLGKIGKKNWEVENSTQKKTHKKTTKFLIFTVLFKFFKVLDNAKKSADYVCIAALSATLARWLWGPGWWVASRDQHTPRLILHLGLSALPAGGRRQVSGHISGVFVPRGIEYGRVRWVRRRKRLCLEGTWKSPSGVKCIQHCPVHQQFCFSFKQKGTQFWGWMQSVPII